MQPDRNIWYPFAQQKLADEPIFLTHGKGSMLYDRDGNAYIDAISSWWTNIHGHAHPYLSAAAVKQFNTLEHVIFAGFTHQPAEDLARRLLHRTPYLQKVFFSDNGSTSVEVAIKMALQYWHNKGKKKRKIIALEGAYHGDTFGAMSVGGRDVFSAPFHSLLFDVVHIPFPEENSTAYLEAMETALLQEDIAAFIYEPLVQGAAGMRMYGSEALSSLLRMAKKHGALCIADEVMTGFYRTGRFLASDHIADTADIICLSKGITGGSLPLAVTLCTDTIYHAFYGDDRMQAFYHGHSYTGNPLACAIANASLDLLEQAETLANIECIEKAHIGIVERLRSVQGIQNIRHRGTIIAFDIKVSDAGYFSDIRDALYQKAIGNGVLLRPLGNTIYIMPPYCISDAELQKVYNTCLLLANMVG